VPSVYVAVMKPNLIYVVNVNDVLTLNVRESIVAASRRWDADLVFNVKRTTNFIPQFEKYRVGRFGLRRFGLFLQPVRLQRSAESGDNKKLTPVTLFCDREGVGQGVGPGCLSESVY
jgi:hypothetical protein